MVFPSLFPLDPLTLPWPAQELGGPDVIPGRRVVHRSVVGWAGVDQLVVHGEAPETLNGG